MQKICADIKQKSKQKALKAALLFVTAIFITACGSEEISFEKSIKVTIQDSMFFEQTGVAGSVKKGEDFVATIKMIPEYAPVSCTYKDYSIRKTELDTYELTLKNVNKPSRVIVTSERDHSETLPEKHCSIIFDMNDGSGVTYQQDYTLTHHIRANTKSGEGLERDGYTLIGWNTNADASGTHVGLGSRISMDEGETKTLYAEWVKQIDQDKFAYSELEDGTIALTGYKGSDVYDKLVIPSKVDGKDVTAITSTFTLNIRCGKISAPAIVLPSTINCIEASAFNSSNINEIYCFDNLSGVEVKAFPKGLKTAHINAIMPPHLQDFNYNVQFADNLDRIIENKDKKKLILFSGCSMCYGISSPRIQETFKDYVVIDAGINGEFNALFQLQIMLPYIQEGDILVHAPEQPNYYQLMQNKWVDERIFCMTEGNYDLLADADFSYSSLFFQALDWYGQYRAKKEECTYDDYNPLYNMYGDYLEERPYVEETELERDEQWHTKDWGFDTSLISERKLGDLIAIYNKFRLAGATVYWSWAPMNVMSPKTDTIMEDAVEYQNLLKAVMKTHDYKIISEVTDYIYKGRYFYDTDYHLNDLGIVIRTQQLIKDLSAVIK